MACCAVVLGNYAGTTVPVAVDDGRAARLFEPPKQGILAVDSKGG